MCPLSRWCRHHDCHIWYLISKDFIVEISLPLLCLLWANSIKPKVGLIVKLESKSNIHIYAWIHWNPMICRRRCQCPFFMPFKFSVVLFLPLVSVMSFLSCHSEVNEKSHKEIPSLFLSLLSGESAKVEWCGLVVRMESSIKQLTAKQKYCFCSSKKMMKKGRVCKWDLEFHAVPKTTVVLMVMMMGSIFFLPLLSDACAIH